MLKIYQLKSGKIYDLASSVSKSLERHRSSQVTVSRASLHKLKANPIRVLVHGNGRPVAVSNRNETLFYCVPADVYEHMVELLDDIELLKQIQARQSEESVKVSLDEL